MRVSMSAKVLFRYHARRALYGCRLTRNIAARLSRTPVRTPEENARYWDDMLSGTTWKPYLGDTFSIDARNAIISTIVKHHAAERPAVLDLGCAGGTIALALPPFEQYLGVDVSAYATNLAGKNIVKPNVSFATADLRTFEIVKNAWGAIIFGEVLYYLQVDVAVAEIDRCATGLRPGGIIIVCMKDDGKSHIIFTELARRYAWIDGVLWQEKPARPEYRIAINRERPAYLIGAIRPRT